MIMISNIIKKLNYDYDVLSFIIIDWNNDFNTY